MSVDEDRFEARRVLGICNACGYCNGFCDLFEAAKRRPALTADDLTHLANLCHGCRNCLYACQYAPPHTFAVNVPRTLARMRQRGYAEHVWPRAWSGLLVHPILTALLFSGGAIGLLVGMVWMTVPSDILFASQTGAGAFYRILPWWGMMLIGILPLGWSMLAIGMGLRHHWRAARPLVTVQKQMSHSGHSPPSPQPLSREGRGAKMDPLLLNGYLAPVSTRHLWSALRDVLILRNLRGGGPGCNDLDDRLSHRRRWLHQTLLAGLLLSFAATLAATIYHHALGWQAPYPLLSPPVLLGSLGGIAMMIAVVGLVWLKRREDRTPTDPEARTADLAFLTLLFLVATTGLALLVWRATPAMGLLLAVHLGSVLAFFLLLPYCKFVHAGYRFLALLIEALERETPRRP